MTIFAATLQSALNVLTIDVDTSTLQKLEQHWRLVEEYNRKFNLTAIRDEAEAALKHYLDCLLLLPQLEEAVKPAQEAGRELMAADIGSGAGFPGLVLAMACPHSSWLLLEASQKKCAFLQHCLEKLAIKNARALPLRAEEAGHQGDLRGRMDAVTARAVAALPVLLEYALPLLREGGLFIALKGPALMAEEATAAHALVALGANPATRREFTLPSGEQRVIACYSKEAPTPSKYPRRAGLPEKRPL